MMLRQIRWKIWAVIAAAVLILAISYYNGVVRIGEEREPASYSVILYQHTDNEWLTLMEGIKQAEEDFKVHVNYITMGENDTAAEQAAVVQREMNTGASGILLAPIDSQAVAEYLNDMTIQIPVITVETGVGENFINISADNYEMGQELGRKILADMEADSKEKTQAASQAGTVDAAASDIDLAAGNAREVVIVIKEYMERDSVKQRYQGLVDALESSGRDIHIRTCTRQKGDFSLRLFIGTAFSDGGDYIAALDKFSTEEAVAAWTANRAAFEQNGTFLKVYGIGNTAQTVNDLDNKNLEALVYQNEFNMGYQGIQALVDKDQKGYVNDEFEIMFKLVTKDTLYESENESLLFPST